MIELLAPQYTPEEERLQLQLCKRVFTTPELRLLLEHSVDRVAEQPLPSTVIDQAASFVDELHTIADEADALNTPFVKGAHLLFTAAHREAEKVFAVADAISNRTGIDPAFARERLRPDISYELLTKWAGMLAVEKGLLEAFDGLAQGDS